MELDIENLEALRQYLVRQDHILPSAAVNFEKLEGGVSNRTVKVTLPGGDGWILKQALPKLRVSVDWFSDPARIAVEAKALRWLNRSMPLGATPGFVFEDLANHLLAMEAIPEGHENWKTVLLAGRVEPGQFRQFGSVLGAVHCQSSNSESLRREFADTKYFESLRLEPYYLYTAEQVPAVGSFLRLLVQETRTRKDCLVHGDFSPKNILLYHERLILLDYEVCHFGDPAFDAGFAVAHFLGKIHHLPQVRKQLAEATIVFIKSYRAEISSLDWAAKLEPRLVRHALGCSLARVAGKSPLEYLSAEERSRLRDVLVKLMCSPPASIEDLVSQFLQTIETYADY